MILVENSFPVDILNSIERYIAPLVENATDSLDDDYLCIMRAQQLIYHDLEGLFSNFQHSESYFKWKSETEKRKITTRDQKAGHDQSIILYKQSNLVKLLSKELNVSGFLNINDSDAAEFT